MVSLRVEKAIFFSFSTQHFVFPLKKERGASVHVEMALDMMLYWQKSIAGTHRKIYMYLCT